MRIAQVAPLIESVPPKGYGGTERVVSYLTESLVALGHDVTLFAAGDSKTRAKLVPTIPRSVRLDPTRPDWLMWHTIMLDRVFASADAFDVIHFHVDFLHYLLAKRCATPCVLLSIGEPALRELYFQNPEFGFELVREIAGRLTSDIHQLEERIATPIGADPGAPRGPA